MSVSTIIAIFRFLIWLVGVVQKAYDQLPPDQKEKLKVEYDKWQEAIKNCQDPMAGPPPGSGP